MNQQWNAADYSENAAYVSDYGHEVLDLLAPRMGEKVLDLGCGDGVLALALQQRGVCVQGVDSSAEMVAAARDRGVSADVVSGEELTFDGVFDAVFTNAALHWMKDYRAVVSGVQRALKHGGRFVGEFGGYGNIAAVVSAMERVFANHPAFGAFENPWYFPSVEEYREVLESGGFRVNSIELLPRPTVLNAGMASWLSIFAAGICAQLDADQKALFLVEVERRLKPVLFTEDGWVADYVRLRFSATKL